MNEVLFIKENLSKPLDTRVQECWFFFCIIQSLYFIGMGLWTTFKHWIGRDGMKNSMGFDGDATRIFNGGWEGMNPGPKRAFLFGTVSIKLSSEE